MSIITQLWREQPGEYFYICTNSPWKEHVFKKGELGKVDAFIAESKAKARDIYFCPHGFTQPHRREEFAAATNLLWDDLDEVDPRTLGELRPTMAIESSPGRFVGVWICDGPIEKSLRRRFSYKVKPSKGGGWDFTQVLRVPGTTNYKYKTQPLVRQLWSSGPSYALKKLRELLPQDKDDDRETPNDKVLRLFKRYEKKLPAWTRKELLNGKPRHGNRSDMIWKLNHTLLEAGASTGEAFTLLWASPWNKYVGRSGGEEQLKRELEKAVGEHLGREPAGAGSDDWKGLTIDEIELKSLSWLWYPYLARGELTILEGDPGVGKSYLAQMVGMMVCDGGRLPSSRPIRTKGEVMYFDVENSGGTVTKARLIDNGLKNSKLFHKIDRPFSVDDDDAVTAVLNAIEETRPTLVVFDTINAYIGRADTNNAAQTTQSFALFRDIAQRFNCSVLVLRHLTKGGRDKALYRGQGSIAFAGLARIIMTLGLDPEDGETKILAMTKNNFTKPAKSLAFHITELPATLKREDRSKFEWGEWREDITADDLVSSEPTSNSGERGAVLSAAKELLTDALADGPMEHSQLMRMAETRSISSRVLLRASEALGVKRTQHGFGKEKDSKWAL